MDFKPGDLVKIKHDIAGVMTDKAGLVLKTSYNEWGGQFLYQVSLINAPDQQSELYHPMWLEKIQDEHET